MQHLRFRHAEAGFSLLVDNSPREDEIDSVRSMAVSLSSIRKYS